MNKKVLYLVHGAVIAALYVVLTLLANALGLANYAIQVRFSEALTILPVFTPAAIPGLFLGCIISNTLTGCMLLDIIFGSIATLIGAAGTWLLRNKAKWLAPLPPIIANTIIVPFVLAYVYHAEGAISVSYTHLDVYKRQAELLQLGTDSSNALLEIYALPCYTLFIKVGLMP